jgi:hypothetical protein
LGRARLGLDERSKQIELENTLAMHCRKGFQSVTRNQPQWELNGAYEL